MDIPSFSDEDFQNIVRQKLLGMTANNGAKQKVISLADVEQYINEGWEYVDTLPKTQKNIPSIRE